jgi:hypothetical protein
MALATRGLWLLVGLLICAVAQLVLLASPQESTKLGIERPDCFYGMVDGVVTATPIPGCPTRPPGRPGPSLTPMTREELERLLRPYPHGDIRVGDAPPTG